MSHFSIRELLLLTVVIALGLGWWLHARRISNEAAELRIQLGQQQQLVELVRLEEQLEQERVEKWKASEAPPGALVLPIPPPEGEPKVRVIPISPNQKLLDELAKGSK